MTNKGLTLVEVLVVVTIMGILTAAGFTFVNQFGARQELRSATDSVLAAIKSARSLAVSQQKPAGFTESVSVVNVAFDNAAGLVYAYPNNNTSQRYFSNTYGENGGIQVTGGTVRFTAYEGKVAADEAGVPLPYGTNIDVIIRSLETGETRAIVIQSSGVIDD